MYDRSISQFATKENAKVTPFLMLLMFTFGLGSFCNLAYASVYQAHGHVGWIFPDGEAWAMVDTGAHKLSFTWSFFWAIAVPYPCVYSPLGPWAYISVEDASGLIYYTSPIVNGTRLDRDGEINVHNYFGHDTWVTFKIQVTYQAVAPVPAFLTPTITIKIYTGETGGGGGHNPPVWDPCPTLFVWNGNDYVDYGVINIHNPTGEDVVREVPVHAEDVDITNQKVTFRLREGWEGLNQSESVIDQVELYAVDNDGNRYLCPLISAEHSRLGKVLPQLLLSDDVTAQILLLETIDLEFIVPHQNPQGFTFVIEGCNLYK